ncbi:MAG: LysM peptidoglycan-binding domain-containing protein [Proteobacteria bacterium]|nr:LysM peptidoglycan-binding domain-containing protein [Pseudomonadota bacterium]
MPAVSVKTQRAAEADVSNQGAQQASANASKASAKDEQMTQNAPQYVTAEVYKVKTGDSFWAIAEKFNVPGGYKFLAEYNGMTPKSVIHPGDMLNIPRLNDSAQANNATADAPVQAPAQANNAPAEAPAQANNAPAEAPAQANNAPAEAPAQSNNAPANAPAQSNAPEGELDLPTKSPLEQLLEEHPDFTTNQDLINYFYSNSNNPYQFARSIYSVEIDDLITNRRADIDLDKPRAVFANKNSIFSYIVSNLGMSNAGACGVLANIQSESNFDTTCVGDNGTSYGLCQWHDNRMQNLIDFCETHGYDLNSIPGQLEFLASELSEGYTGVLNAMKNAPNTEQGAYDAAYKWCVNFEKPDNMEAMGRLRGGVAKIYFQTYGNITAKPKTEQPVQQEPAAPAISPLISAPVETPAGNEPAGNEPAVAGNEPAGNSLANDPEPVADNKPKASGYVETSDNTVNEIQKAHPNGITVSLYGGTQKDSYGNAGYNNNNNNREFANLATGVAKSTKTVDTALSLGSAMMANSSDAAKNLTNTVYKNLHDRYAQSKPESAEAEPEHLKIKNLSLYYHGSQDSLNFPRGSLGSQSVDAFVNEIRGSLRGDVRVQLYACNTAKGEENFAKSMAESLGDEARVYGHETAGHATENSYARYYDGQGQATDMFDALMPETWIKQEAARIWGDNYSSAAYTTLVSRLKLYYKDICGMYGGWDSLRRKEFEAAIDDAPKAYGDAFKYSGMGRAMFSDTEGSASNLQQGWRNWALTNERSNLKRVGALAATFEDVNATPAAAATSTVASAEPAQAQANEAPAQNSEEKPATDPSKLVVIGDSRTVGLQAFGGLSAGQIIAEVGKGYSWLVNNALPQAKQSGLTSYVILLGVNDLGNAESYIKKYTDLMNSGISLTIVNVGPINEAKAKEKGYKVTESQIVDFNNKIASVEGARVIDLYSYMKDNGFETSDGLHYSVSTYKNIVSFLQSNW